MHLPLHYVIVAVTFDDCEGDGKKKKKKKTLGRNPKKKTNNKFLCI